MKSMKLFRSFLIICLPIVFCCFTATSFPFQKFQDEKKEVETGACAVFVAPTAAQIDSLKTKMGDNQFYAFASKKMTDISNARVFLESKKVLIVNKESVGSVFFKMDGQKDFEQKISGIMWGIILFNGKSQPVVADMSNIEKEYNRIFEK